MKLGFASAIFPDLSLQQVVEFASSSGFSCVELMCWPKGEAERRYAGVTHIDVVELTSDQAKQINELVSANSIDISGLGYYPNPLTPDSREAAIYVNHIRQVILAAELLAVEIVNTFIGRDWTRSIEENWPQFKETWQPLIKFAENHNVSIAIENCPMLFTKDEWPGGKNLAYAPAIWRRMFEEIPSPNFGLNFDPSHLVWLQIDYLKPLCEFSDKIFHLHAKDVRVDRHRLDEVSILGYPLEYHTPKLPGLGDVNWGQFFSVLSDVGYQGAVCIEVEDRAYEETLERRHAALIQSGSFLKQLIS